MPSARFSTNNSTGIAITTHNRTDQLFRLLKSIRENTDHNTLVAVFDDGSANSPTPEAMHLCNYYLRAPSKGISENKNRALYYYSVIRPTRRILLLEDDLLITEPNWLRRWEKAIDRFSHINFTFPSWTTNEEGFKGGKGTPRSPHRWTKVTGQVTGVDTAILRNKIGYMNPMFTGFGHEHLEWTERWASEGFGGKITKKKRVYFSLKPKGISLQDCPSTGKSYDTSKNRDIHVSLRKRGYPKIMAPWQDEAERDRFLSVFQTRHE
jgi:glycosyltransferase involved in cell wall biosynthesis